MKIHKTLITIDIDFNEIYLKLHKDRTTNQAIKDTENESNHVCFALTPENALVLAKELIDIAWFGKQKKESIGNAELETDEEK